MAVAARLALLSVFLSLAAHSAQSSFPYHGFNDTSFDLDGGATVVKPSGALRLTNRSQKIIGHAFYPIPFRMFDESSNSFRNASSFNTSFVFAIDPSSPGQGGYGLAFTLAPSTQFAGAESGHFLGLFNHSNNGSSSNHIFAVEFDTVNGQDEGENSKGNHVGININSISSVASKPAGYSNYGNPNNGDFQIDSGNPIVVWIEYDGPRRTVNVTIAPMTKQNQKPTEPLLSHQIDLTPFLKEQMFAGFSASTGDKTSSHYILGWSFAVNGSAPPLNHSLLPNPPKEQDPPPSRNSHLKVLFAALSVVAIIGVLFLAFWFRRMWQTESLEDWERDCPHRFNYRDLYTATKGFKDSELIGIGGFGSVYKGHLRSTGIEIAVKRVRRNSKQGMKEFAAEIESLGRLRHKNLVNLQGWCKKQNDLLIVYDYIPNGCLYSLLYHPKNNYILNWKERFNILKGIAAGLLYLHEEWEQVVIHRDVKPSNVLIDGDMNARLSDFGLARQYDHNEVSHTTGVVGTIGYIAPELVRTGKASKSTDVFGYGIMLLEVACGRKPLEPEQFILVDWVMECYETGGILYAADPKLNSVYEIEEMEMVLKLGLLCTHQRPEARPTMRRVTRFLHGDDPLPAVDGWDCSQSYYGSNSRTTEVISAMSYRSSSIGAISSGSIDAGR
ncbi:probable L-type lectin-domain containing receptor kinase VI.1 [Momordica charantia]|uniref:non-specific serine/threonine protein kinase n=1 Tax=Momordica charantia TaxID=3673 RepID=A0A6J1CVA1_MOMCH|nr:probable L-type lectin-domain containing receptor kinase VI.1 [Momordica charantia]